MVEVECTSKDDNSGDALHLFAQTKQSTAVTGQVWAPDLLGPGPRGVDDLTLGSLGLSCLFGLPLLLCYLLLTLKSAFVFHHALHSWCLCVKANVVSREKLWQSSVRVLIHIADLEDSCRLETLKSGVLAMTVIAPIRQC